jgi:hypothetical protein
MINHMTKNKERVEACLAGGISHTQVCGKRWKTGINRDVTGRNEKSVVKA